MDSLAISPPGRDWDDEELEMIRELQTEARRRKGLPTPWTCVSIFTDETRVESVKHAVQAGADISGNVVLLTRYCTRKEWLDRVAEMKPGSWFVDAGHHVWWSTNYPPETKQSKKEV
tara:strand:- start:1458 stop:1808 length:351 start_codon:yes stop_codon:yes gene_type:complete